MSPAPLAGRCRMAALAVLLAPTAAMSQPAAPTDAPTPQASSVSLPEIEVIAKALNQARINIEPKIGASTYTMTNSAIQDLPGGSNTPIDDAILQMPGVDQDNAANGGLHVRNEHLNVQYRIDGVIIPDGVSFFGQDLSARFVDSMQLITGSLPAQYGLRTAGIVDIQSKSGLFEPGGTVSMNGGSYATLNPSLEYGGSVDGYNYFFSGDYLQSAHGVNGVTPKYNQIHDQAWQTHDFAYLEKILDPNNKISVMAGEFSSWFQIPNNPSQPTFGGISAINGIPISNFNSATLNEQQNESSQFAAVSFLHSQGPLDLQISGVTKYSALNFHPDQQGDLAFNGIGEGATRTSWANNLQVEGAYRLTLDHTLRSGLLLGIEHVTSNTNSDALNQIGSDSFGNPVFATTTTSVAENTQKTSYTTSLYLQDEWKALPTVTVNYGARFDFVDGYTHGEQLSPRLNTVWNATPTTTLHAGYAMYFTPPPQELVSAASLQPFANTSAAPQVTQNSSIKNERAHYFDVGVTQDFLPGLKGGVDAYYKFATNLIDEGQFGAPVIATPFNYHHGINRGVELTANYTKGAFVFYGNLAIATQLGKGIESAQFNFSPDDLLAAGSYVHTDHSQLYTASGGAAYTWYGTRFAVDIIAGSGLRTQQPGTVGFNSSTVPSYEQVNLTISHRFETAPGGPVTARFSVVNLLDEIYLLRSQTGIGVFANQFGPRRSIFASLSKEF
jgi:TonB dependent receptor